MLTIILGFTEFSVKAAPTVLYAGHDVQAASAAIADSKLPRIERLDGPITRIVRSVRPEAKPPVPKLVTPPAAPVQPSDSQSVSTPAETETPPQPPPAAAQKKKKA